MRRRRTRRQLLLEQQANNAATVNQTDKRIGVFLHESLSANNIGTASDRIRGKWIVRNCSEMEIFNPQKNYDVVIFHIACKEIEKHGRIKLLDVCDKVWDKSMETYNPNFLEEIQKIDAIIVPTIILKEEVQKITSKPVYVIDDGHDLNHYSVRLPNTHQRTAEEVVWFGYGQNAHILKPFINYIKSLGLKLKVISQNQNFDPLQYADVFIPWNESTYIQEISKSDFAILPPNQSYKSRNKEFTALFSGIPVAKTREEIARFMFPQHRREEMENRKFELPGYDAKLRAKEYLSIINKIDQSDNIGIYTSNVGSYDKKRSDIRVFSDAPSDIFKHSVMNAKIYKVLSHKYIPNPISIYLDANIQLNAHKTKIIEEFLGDHDMVLFKHPFRNCLYEEYPEALKRVRQEFQNSMHEQIQNYKQEGMPEKFGLAECGMIIRRNNDIVNEFNERWWAEICRYTNRDQVSFPYVWWKMKDRIKIRLIEGANVRNHSYFTYIDHGR